MGDERQTEQYSEFLFPSELFVYSCSPLILGTLMIRTLNKRADIYLRTSEWPLYSIIENQWQSLASLSCYNYFFPIYFSFFC